jgi:type IV pilus assembly protein PilP
MAFRAFKSISKTGSWLLLLLALATGLQAQDPNRTLSAKPKADADKTGDAANGGAARSLQVVKDSTASKPVSRFRKQEVKAEEKIERVDLNTPIKAAEAKIVPRALKDDGRDPFRPATLRKKAVTRPRENLSPLERFELNQLKIVGIVWDIKEPRAMVEDNAKLGYTIKVGAPIGSNDGVVKAIHRNEIIVEEFFYDVYGARRKREVSMKLSTE